MSRNIFISISVTHHFRHKTFLCVQVYVRLAFCFLFILLQCSQYSNSNFFFVDIFARTLSFAIFSYFGMESIT